LEINAAINSREAKELYCLIAGPDPPDVPKYPQGIPSPESVLKDVGNKAA